MESRRVTGYGSYDQEPERVHEARQCASGVRAAVRRPWVQCLRLCRSLSLTGDSSIWGIPTMWVSDEESCRSWLELCQAGAVCCVEQDHMDKATRSHWTQMMSSHTQMLDEDLWGLLLSCWCRVCLDLSGLSLLSVLWFLLFEVEMCALRDCISKLYDFKKIYSLTVKSSPWVSKKTHSLFCIIQSFPSLVFA